MTTVVARTGGDLRSVLRIPVRLWVLVLFMAIGFASGFVVGGLEREPAAVVPATVEPVTVDPSMLAPPLSEDELKGGLPANHPVVGGGDGQATDTSVPSSTPPNP